MDQTTVFQLQVPAIKFFDSQFQSLPFGPLAIFMFLILSGLMLSHFGSSLRDWKAFLMNSAVVILISMGFWFYGPLSLAFFLLADGLIFVKRIRSGCEIDQGSWVKSGLSFLVIFAGVGWAEEIPNIGIASGFIFVALRALGWPISQPGTGLRQKAIDNDFWFISYWITLMTLLTYQPNLNQPIVVAAILLFLQLRPNLYSLTLALCLILLGATHAPLFVVISLAFLPLTSRWSSFALAAVYLVVLQPSISWETESVGAASFILFLLLGRAWIAAEALRRPVWMQVVGSIGALAGLGVVLLIDDSIIQSRLRTDPTHSATMMAAFLAGGALSALWKKFWSQHLPKFDPMDFTPIHNFLFGREWVRPRKVISGDTSLSNYLVGDGCRVEAIFEPLIVVLLLGGAVWLALFL